MLAFIIRRLIQSVVVMFFVALLAFAMFRFVGDPVKKTSHGIFCAKRDHIAVAPIRLFFIVHQFGDIHLRPDR